MKTETIKSIDITGRFCPEDESDRCIQLRLNQAAAEHLNRILFRPASVPGDAESRMIQGLLAKLLNEYERFQAATPEDAEILKAESKAGIESMNHAKM
jgi:hypothetical protein